MVSRLIARKPGECGEKVLCSEYVKADVNTRNRKYVCLNIYLYGTITSATKTRIVINQKAGKIRSVIPIE